MRAGWLCLALAACDVATPPMPPHDAPAPGKPESCPRICAPEDSDCAYFPYEQLPKRCVEVCYYGSCCELVEGAWRTATIDCARPMADAGVDAPLVQAGAWR